MDAFTLIRGNSPLILAMPHTGTWLPENVWDALNENGRTLKDTDWHIDRLYSGLMPDVTIVKANFHRYAIDANRDPSDQSLYPGQNTTSLCPLTDFDGNGIYRDGHEPDGEEIASRRERFHAPYHAAIAAEIDRAKAEHGVAVLYDCHSIRSRIPFLFEGILPDFNVGTFNGTSCASDMEAEVFALCQQAAGYTSVLNGRFKGGWTTRQYGRPADNVHAIQMELAQATHLASEVSPFAFDERRAKKLRPHLKTILETLVALAKAHAQTTA